VGQPIKRTTVPRNVRENRNTVKAERRKPELPGPYIYVGDFDTLDPPVATWQSPAWENSFTWFGSRYVGFRHGLDGDTEFIGSLDLTAGAVTGTVAFTLPVPWRGASFDFVFPIFTGTTEWINGIMSVDATTGECTVYWPVLADPI
jgi:hypothetical protein